MKLTDIKVGMRLELQDYKDCLVVEKFEDESFRIYVSHSNITKHYNTIILCFRHYDECMRHCNPVYNIVAIKDLEEEMLYKPVMFEEGDIVEVSADGKTWYIRRYRSLDSLLNYHIVYEGNHTQTWKMCRILKEFEKK